MSRLGREGSEEKSNRIEIYFLGMKLPFDYHGSGRMSGNAEFETFPELVFGP